MANRSWLFTSGFINAALSATLAQAQVSSQPPAPVTGTRVAPGQMLPDQAAATPPQTSPGGPDAAAAAATGTDQATGAQAGPTTTEQVPASGANDIVVVGSRIVRNGYQAPTPLTVVGAEKLATSANSNIAQAITILPAFSGSANTRSGTGSGSTGVAGINSLNLRSLGPNRTLVLLDGHRVPAVNAAGIVDVNTLPQGLVARVDVVTGGASSVYGSDAVAGVVNFVLDDKFLGLKGSVAGGVTNYGDGENYTVDLSAGFKFADDRGRLFLSGQRSDDHGEPGLSDRKWTRLGFQNIVNPSYTATNGQPQRLIVGRVGYLTAAPGGVVLNASTGRIFTTGPLAATYFGAGGAILPLTIGDIVSDPFMRGGDWEMGDSRRLSPISPSEQRNSLFGRATFQITDHINVYGQIGWTQTQTRGDLTSYYLPSTAGPVITLDNAFLPLTIRNRMVQAGVTTIRVGTLNQDLGISYTTTDRSTLIYSGGFNGDFGALGTDWKWDAYAQRGESRVRIDLPNNISRARYTLATDAVVGPTGAIVCRSTLTNPTNGCSPYNVFGTGVNDPNGSAIRYIQSPSFQQSKIGQSVFAASITGEPFSDWAGPVSVALSAEHRRDTAFATVDDGSRTLDHIYGNYSFIDGKTSVTEGAVETVVPLLKDSPFGRSLDLNAAARYTSYSLAGTAVTWKAGLVYAPIPDIKFRVTRSRDIRAPSIQELFSPAVTTRSTIFDPFTNTIPAFNQTVRGNLGLSPEKADTLGVGVVLQPSFIPGLSASVDYWKIEINDAISSVSAANVLLLCFGGTRPDLCANITRANGVVTDVVSQSINFAVQRVRGIDIEASYRLPLGNISGSLPGTLTIQTNATHYLEDFIDSRVSPGQDFAGENSGANPPKWRYVASLNYETGGGLNASLTARGFSDGVQFANYIECSTTCPTSTAIHPTVNDNHMPGATYFDASLAYNFKINRSKVTAFVNVRNLTDRDPYPSVAGTNFVNGGNSLLYDVDGRVYRFGLRFTY